MIVRRLFVIGFALLSLIIRPRTSIADGTSGSLLQYITGTGCFSGTRALLPTAGRVTDTLSNLKSALPSYPQERGVFAGSPYVLFMAYDRAQRSYYAEVRFPKFTEFYLGHNALLPPKHVSSHSLRGAQTLEGARLGVPLETLADRYGDPSYEYMCRTNAAAFTMPYPRENDTIQFFETEGFTYQIKTLEYQ